MEVKFFQPQRDYLRFKREYDAAWESVNIRGDLILRKDVEEFEERLADYVGTKYSVAVSSGTDALKLSYEATGLGSSYWSIAIPSHTFKSTAGAVKMVHPDISIDLYDLGEIPKDADVAVVAHIAGEIYPLFKTSYALIEDAAQALGAIKNPTTSAQTFSFYPAKILGCKGDAGAVTTNDYKVYEYIKEARNHFKGDNRDFGGNYRMDNLKAALLNVKIQYIDWILERRKEIAEMYLEKLEGVGLPNNQLGRVWQDFIIRIPENKISARNRNSLYEYLKTNGVETMKNEYFFTPQYPKLPKAAKYEAETLRIPCNENLTDEEIKEVIKKINGFFRT